MNGPYVCSVLLGLIIVISNLIPGVALGQGRDLSDNRVWYSTAEPLKGIFRVIRYALDGQIEQPLYPSTAFILGTYAIDGNGKAWIGDMVLGGMYRYEKDYTIPPTFISTGGYGVRGIAFDPWGNAWISAWVPSGDQSLSALVQYSPTGEYITNTPRTLATRIATDADGNIWIITPNSSDRYRIKKLAPDGRTLLTLGDSAEDNDMCANHFAIDRNGGCWVSSSCPVEHRPDDPTPPNSTLYHYGFDQYYQYRLLSKEQLQTALGAIAIDSQQSAWVADVYTKKILVVAPDGTHQNEIALRRVPGMINFDGTGAAWVVDASEAPDGRYARRVTKIRYKNGSILEMQNFSTGLGRAFGGGDNTGFIYANSAAPYGDFDSDGYYNGEELTDGSNPFNPLEKAFKFAAGNVNTISGPPIDVLKVNGRSASETRRVLYADHNASITVTIDAPPANTTSTRFVVYLMPNIVDPTEVPTPYDLPFQLGSMAFISPLTGATSSKKPYTLANTMGHYAQLGIPVYTAAAVPVGGSSTILNLTPGTLQPGSFVLQGLVMDEGASSPGFGTLGKASVTNAIFVNVY